MMNYIRDHFDRLHEGLAFAKAHHENHPDFAEVLPWSIVQEPSNLPKHEVMPIEGSWRLVSSHNFDTYLAGVGATPLMASMIMKNEYMLTIYRDIDGGWKILAETSIKAKSIKGYMSRNYKVTSNKFLLEQPKPEVLEDWDPRLVVTTVTLSDDHRTLTLEQVAESELVCHKSSKVVYEVHANDDDLTATFTTEDGVVAIRNFVRHHDIHDGPMRSRKLSLPF